MRIVVDAMGGDHAPEVVIKGAVEAVKECSAEIVLVGKKAEVEAELKKHRNVPSSITVHDAPAVVSMDEPAAVTVRKKRDSSINIGIELVKSGKADAFFSAGNTGAVVCSASLNLGMLPGIERPAIALVIPSVKGKSLLLDVGANIDVKPTHLLQYGIMGAAYAQCVLSKNNPTVGLLNIGEEAIKGTGILKEAYKLLSESSLNFSGNLEAKHIFAGICDVIVCDGMIGNIALKVTEGAAEAMGVFLKRCLLSNLTGKIGVLLIRNNLMSYKKKLDYAEYGGAPLLGVNGLVLIGHGRSSPLAIKNAIKTTVVEVERKVNEKIIESVSQFKIG